MIGIKTSIFLALVLAGCSAQVDVSSNEQPKDDSKYYSISCLDGVAYYHGGWTLTPKIDPKTLKPCLCK